MPAASTIVLITPDRIIRADFGGGSRPTLRGLWQEPATAEDGVSAVETALFLGPRIGKRVWVLSADVWTQVVAVPARAVADADRAQVSQALAFEAEPISGIGAGDAAVGFRELSDTGRDRRYWMSQAPAHELGRIEDAIGRIGGKLMGMAHPAGIAAGSGVGGRGGPRVELWPGAVFGAAGREIAVATADGRMTEWRQVLGEWANGRDFTAADKLAYDAAFVRPAVADAGADPGAGAEGETDWRVLNDDGALSAWFEQCAAALSRQAPAAPGGPGVPGAPIIRPSARPMTARQRGGVTIALCALVAVACIAHYLWLEQRRSDAQAQINDAQAQAKSLVTLRKQADDARKSAASLEQRIIAMREQLTLREATREAHRRRWSRLLALLAEHAPADLAVRRIEGRAYDVSLSGVCLQPELANELAAKLNRDLPALGWRVHPPQKQAMRLAGDGGPWSFRLLLKDAAVVPPDADGAGAERSVARGADARGADARTTREDRQ